MSDYICAYCVMCQCWDTYLLYLQEPAFGYCYIYAHCDHYLPADQRGVLRGPGHALSAGQRRCCRGNVSLTYIINSDRNETALFIWSLIWSLNYGEMTVLLCLLWNMCFKMCVFLQLSRRLETLSWALSAGSFLSLWPCPAMGGSTPPSLLPPGKSCSLLSLGQLVASP